MMDSCGHRALNELFGWGSSNEKHNADALPKPCRTGPRKFLPKPEAAFPAHEGVWVRWRHIFLLFLDLTAADVHVHSFTFKSVKGGVLTLFLVLTATSDENPISCTCTSARSRLGWPYPVFRQINLDNKPVCHRIYEWLR